MVTEKEILKALSVIIDPDFKQDIVTLGFIKNIKINSFQKFKNEELELICFPK